MPEKRSDTKFLALARKRWELASEEESENRKKALDDLKFRAGDQWDGNIKSDRDGDNRPCLTINQLPQFIRQVTNEQRQNRAAVNVSPTGEGATKETAEVFQGMIRHIEYDSDADIAYDTAGQSAVTSGIGYFRFVTEFAGDDSFDQDIKFKRIRNPFTVYMDPASQEPDASDAEWCFIAVDYTEEDYKREFPKSKLAETNEWESIGDQIPGWASKEWCRVVEYFYKEYTQKTLLLLTDGSKGYLEDLPEDHRPPEYRIKAKRTVAVPQVKWCKMNGIEVLDETDWLGQWIPVVPVLGDELDVNGKRVLEGIVRHAKDPARMYNYWVSAETEMIALAPKAPFIGVAGQFEGYEEKWTSANRKNLAYLEYNPKTVAGNLAPPPQRNQYEPPIQAINHARMASRDDLKATTGIYASGLGEQGNEQTGRAILARQHQGQISNFHYIDNMTRAIRHAGRILVDLIPKIYDTERIVRIIAPDGGQKMVKVNGPTGEVDPKTKVERIYALGVGKYDVVVEAGPSYHTKREEALASMLQLSQNYPKLMEVAGDIVVGNMDWEGALEISNRLKKTLPPGYAEDEQGNEEMPPEAIKKIQDMQQLIDTQTKALNHAQDENNQKEEERESKEKIAFAQMRNNLLIESMKIDQKDAHVLAQNELKWLDLQMQASQAEADKPEVGEEPNTAAGAQSTLAPQAQPTYTDASVPSGPGSQAGGPPTQ
jgi:hypothetical protein